MADDVVHVRNIEGRELIGAPMALGRSHMEVRGLGIINVPALFGIGSIRTEKRLDLVITLRPAEDLNDVDRIGLDRKNDHVPRHAPASEFSRLVIVGLCPTIMTLS